MLRVMPPGGGGRSSLHGSLPGGGRSSLHASLPGGLPGASAPGPRGPPRAARGLKRQESASLGVRRSQDAQRKRDLELRASQRPPSPAGDEPRKRGTFNGGGRATFNRNSRGTFRGAIGGLLRTSKVDPEPEPAEEMDWDDFVDAALGGGDLHEVDAQFRVLTTA